MTRSSGGQDPLSPPVASASAPQPRLVRLPMPPLVPTVTYVILGTTAAVYILQVLSVAVFGYAVYQIDWLEIYGARFNDAIHAGELWRFITPALLHGSVPHIFFNMYALLSIGSFLERQFGHGRFALLYILGAFSGNVFSFLLARGNGYSVGASTAVFGLVAAEWIFFYQNRQLFGDFGRRAMGNTVFIIVINLLIGLSPGIDNWGHVGGLLGGAIFAWFAGPRWTVTGLSPDLKLEDQREFREMVIGAGTVIIIFSALAVWGMII